MQSKRRNSFKKIIRKEYTIIDYAGKLSKLNSLIESTTETMIRLTNSIKENTYRIDKYTKEIEQLEAELLYHEQLYKSDLLILQAKEMTTLYTNPDASTEVLITEMANNQINHDMYISAVKLQLKDYYDIAHQTKKMLEDSYSQLDNNEKHLDELVAEKQEVSVKIITTSKNSNVDSITVFRFEEIPANTRQNSGNDDIYRAYLKYEKMCSRNILHTCVKTYVHIANRWYEEIQYKSLSEINYKRVSDRRNNIINIVVEEFKENELETDS